MRSYWPSQTRNPLGVYNTLSWEEIGALFRLVDEFDITTFIEFGVFRGGLSSLMISRTMFDFEFRYCGVEKDLGKIDYKIIAACEHNPRATIYVGDVFADDVKTLVGNYARRKPLLLFCNASDRVKELLEYLPIIDTGDVLVSRCLYDGSIIELKTKVKQLNMVYLNDTRLVVFRK